MLHRFFHYFPFASEALTFAVLNIFQSFLQKNDGLQITYLAVQLME